MHIRVSSPVVNKELSSLKFSHKEGDKVAAGQMAGLRGAAVWFFKKKEWSVDETRSRVAFLGGLEG